MAKLIFRYGAMGSSKTANALMVRYNYLEKGKNVVILKPACENRDGEKVIRSRIGLEAECEYAEDFLDNYAGEVYDAIIVDCGRYISRDGSEVGSADVGGSKWIFFWGKHTIIPENVIDKDAVIVGFTGSTAEQYAKTHGNTFQAIDGTEYDAAALPDGMNVKNGQLTAKGTAYLRVNGLNKPELEAMNSGERLELVHSPNELNSRRVIFQSAATGEFRGLLAYRAGYTVSYLLEHGYIRFENVISEGNGYLTADVLWTEPADAGMLRFLTLTKDCPQGFWEQFRREEDWYMHLSPAFLVSQMKRGDNQLTTDSLMLLYEPGNRISGSSANRMRLRSDEGSGLSAFKYTDNNRYEIFRSPYSLTVDAQTKSLICKTDGEQTALSAAENLYAQIYINHYRQLYNLPPIQFDANGGDVNGTV